MNLNNYLRTPCRRRKEPEAFSFSMFDYNLK
jgi:hypothetical protein